MARRRRPPRAGALTELQPLKIAGQIAMLQALYYAAALVLMLFTALVAGTGFQLGLVFGWEGVRGDTTTGWVQAFVWLLDGGLCISIAIVILIARSKLVPDFVLTVHFIHLVVTSLYSGRLPRHSMWWAAMLASAAVSIALSVWGCRYRELQPISFGGRRILGSGSVSMPPPLQSPPTDAERREAERDPNADDDQEAQGGGGDVGASRGRGRGRGRDGAGEYEMVHMKPAR